MQWYEELFDNYGATYDREEYTQGTTGECDFIEAEIGHNKTTRILDIGCGTGRHAIELSRRGYNVVGVDLSESQLKQARKKATAEDLAIDFRREDARNLSFDDEFDLAIMLCEGAFPLMETDEMNYQILKNAARALGSGGKLIFTTLNGLFPLLHSLKEYMDAEAGDCTVRHGQGAFDMMTFRDQSVVCIEDDFGNRKTLQCNERYYAPSEITWLLKTLDFQTIAIHGARLGAFSRKIPLTPRDFEMLVIAEK